MNNIAGKLLRRKKRKIDCQAGGFQEQATGVTAVLQEWEMRVDGHKIHLIDGKGKLRRMPVQALARQPTLSRGSGHSEASYSNMYSHASIPFRLELRIEMQAWVLYPLRNETLPCLLRLQ